MDLIGKSVGKKLKETDIEYVYMLNNLKYLLMRKWVELKEKMIKYMQKTLFTVYYLSLKA